MSIADAADPTRPKRVMGFADLVLFYVVTGISLRWIATAAAAGPSSIVIWIAALFLLYAPLALSVLELSSRYPNEGGLYVWSKRAFGDFPGFMTAWTYWTSNLPYFPTVLYFAASNLLFIRHDKWIHLSNNTTYFLTFSVLALTGITVLNIVGLDVGKWLHNLGALAMWIPAAIILVMGVIAWHRFGSATQFTVTTMTPTLQLKDVVFWSTIIFAFAGSETASMMGDEIKNPRRMIPLALFTAGVTIAACYILGTVGVLLALPREQVTNLQGLMEAIYVVAHRIGIYGVIPVAAILIALSNLGAAGAYIACSARLPFVAGIDHFLPRAFGTLHPRWRTPWISLLVQLGCGLVFIVLGQAGTSVKGAYDVLVSMSVIGTFTPFLFVFASLFKVQSMPAGQDVIHVPGGKIVARMVATLGFCVTTATIVISTLPPPDEPNKALAVLKIIGLTALMLGTGAAIYWAGKRRAARAVGA